MPPGMGSLKPWFRASVMKRAPTSPFFFRSGIPLNLSAQVHVHSIHTQPVLSFSRSKISRSSVAHSSSTLYVEQECQVSATSSETQPSACLQLGAGQFVESSTMWPQKQTQQSRSWQPRYTPGASSSSNGFRQQTLGQPAMQEGGYVAHENVYAGRSQGWQPTYRSQVNGYYRPGTQESHYQRPQFRPGAPESYHQRPQWSGNYTQRFPGGSVYGRGWNNQPGKWQENGTRQHRQLNDSRHWLEARDKAKTGEKFVLLSYNILSANNARDHYKELYYHIPMRFVKWEWRKTRLSQEIEYWSPDILCLQEVDRFDDLQNDLKRKGYAGIYKARTGEATDGCAIFWRQKRFSLMEEDSIEFRELGLRDNVAQFCVLKSTNNFEAALNGETSDAQNKCIVVANTHLLFNPKRGDIKLGQVRNLLEIAHEISESWGGAEVVIAGDFNSTPSSPLYKFISDAELDVAPLERRAISGQIASGEGHQGYRRTWFSSWKRNSGITLETSSMVKKEVQVVTEKAARILTVSETQIVRTEIDKSTQLKGENQLMVLKQEPDELMVQKQQTKELVVVDESESAGKWIKEVKMEKDGCENLERWTEDVQFDETVGSTPSSTAEGPCGEEEDEVDSSEVLSPGRQQLQRFLPCGWTVEEMLNATGSSECTKMSHNLNLQSAYAKIQGNPGSRDAIGEPLATTYHKKFMGTVDYIWHTNGLRPLKVLDVLPVNVLRQTGGLPSQKWASDHLALVCEMAFNQ